MKNKLDMLITQLKVHMFAADFHIIVCGLDSIVARRWINGMLVGRKVLVKFFFKWNIFS